MWCSKFQSCAIDWHLFFVEFIFQIQRNSKAVSQNQQPSILIRCGADGPCQWVMSWMMEPLIYHAENKTNFAPQLIACNWNEWKRQGDSCDAVTCCCDYWMLKSKAYNPDRSNVSIHWTISFLLFWFCFNHKVLHSFVISHEKSNFPCNLNCKHIIFSLNGRKRNSCEKWLTYSTLHQRNVLICGQ